MFQELYDIPVRYDKNWNYGFVKAQGIRDMHTLIANNQIVHDNKCRHMKEAYLYYHYPNADGSKQVDDVPVKDQYSHCMDGNQYFFLGRPLVDQTDELYEIERKALMDTLDPFTGLPFG
jgi:hypothetical protein